MDGRAAAPGAGTVVNALATGRGAAFAVDLETTATVMLDPDADEVTGEIAGAPDGDTRLIERCVERVVDRFGTGEGGHVRTDSEVPTAAGLKSSSAAANATVLATLSALGVEAANDPDADVTKTEACRVGVRAARDAGVTVTGAFDDASASMLGGVTVTDNTNDELLHRDDPFATHALVWTPPERAYSADADVSACERVAPMATLATDLALDGDYGRAMTVNGLAFSAALGFPTDPAVEAMADCDGVSLSGTGPSVVAVGDRADLKAVRRLWDDRDGETRLVETRETGARML
ncbi:shikimate kinase [Halobaculum limi]|uniref:shikimate kinase n=1 Tax=Halobaculum limi TaxID=3031916 RepID=UPI00240585C0|nr:shikimate kinase [Halobaculum sp. YSMS11]